MTTLYVFNPEHDIALASDLANFTAPHAGRQLRADLGFLPLLWADAGDSVWADNTEFAAKAWHKFLRRTGSLWKKPRFSKDRAALLRGKQDFQSGNGKEFTCISPWGWDKALKSELIRRGFDAQVMPTDAELEHIRQLSHRRTSARLLPHLQMQGVVGEAFECTQADEVRALLEHYGQVVMKAPWSSSGRGLRFLSRERTPFEQQERWFRHLVERQGSVMVEPFYNKVKDFGMEFHADGNGGIRYEGLSLFHTANGAYIGNILATEKTKREMISAYIPNGCLDVIQQKIMAALHLGNYAGPFGVDMMVVAGNDGFLLHPCVEINLRRTMGHVALTLTPDDDEVVRVMRIELTDNYQLKINKL